MTHLERIRNAPLFRPLDEGESAMIRGGGEWVAASNDYVSNGDGTVTYVGKDYIYVEAPSPSQPA